MKDKTWVWCVEELRDKAVSYKEHGHIRVLDTGSCICKTESAELHPSVRSFNWLSVRSLANTSCVESARSSGSYSRQTKWTRLSRKNTKTAAPWSKIRFYDYPLRRDEPSGDGHGR